MKRPFSLFLIVCMLMTVLSASAAATDSGSTLRIGLYYGSSALAAPQLQNAEGSGYVAGVYDSAKNFSSLYAISATKLVMLKDGANYAKSSDDTYAATSSGTPTVGAYHLQTAQTYAAQTEAAAAAAAAGGFAAYDGSVYRVRTGNYATLAAAKAAAKSGQTAVGGTSTGITVVQTDTGKVLFQYEGGDLFAIAPQGTKPVTWFKGYRYYGNFAYRRTAGSNISVINYVGLEDYVKGVVPYEMSASWNIEALKAQAVCARSYAMGNLNKYASQGFDLTNTTSSQVYRGLNSATSNSDEAVDATAGEYAAVDGTPVTLYFFASDGGATESAENVWDGDYSYLKGVKDPYEDTASATHGIWSVTMSASTVASKLKSAGYSIGTVTSVTVTKLTDVGNVLEVTVKDANGKTVTLEKAKCRTVFGLNSQRYTVTGNGASSTGTSTLGGSILSGAQGVYGITGSTASGVSTSFVFNGRGWGHLVGMSQCGAKAMAERGMTYDQILKFYFTGIELIQQ